MWTTVGLLVGQFRAALGTLLGMVTLLNSVLATSDEGFAYPNRFSAFGAGHVAALLAQFISVH